MSLRWKLMLITGAVLCAMIVALLFAGNTVLMAGFQKAEDLASRGDAKALLNAVDRELANIDILSGDWAIWDDTYQFMQDRNDDYIKANATDVALADLHLNLLVLADMDGRIILGRAFDLEQKPSASVLKSIEAHLSSNSPLRRLADPKKPLTGLLCIPEGILLVAASPIFDTACTKPARGVLIMGRWLDAPEVIAHLSMPFPARQSLTIRRTDAPDPPAHIAARSAAGGKALGAGLPPDFAIARDGMTGIHSIFFQVRDEKEISAYALLKDIYGKPAAILRVNLPRPYYQMGMTALSHQKGIIIAAGFMLLGLVWGLQERIVLVPLTRLAAKVHAIGAGGDMSARVAMDRSDETGQLAAEIDRMLEARERRQTSLRESEDRYRTLVENADVGITRVDSQYRILMVNAAMGRMLHKPVSALTGRQCFREFEKRSEVCPHCPGMRAMASGLPTEVETRGVRDDGSSFPVRIRAFPLPGTDRKAQGFIEVIEDITERKAAEQKIFDYQTKLKTLVFELTLAEERTRREIATELHDLIGQSLSMAKLRLQKAGGGMGNNSPSASDLTDAIALVDQAIQNSRTLVFELCPPMLSDLGLEAALEWLVEQFGAKHALKVRFHDGKGLVLLPDDPATLLFRAARELLTNVVKHARAHEATVSIWTDNDYVHVSVEDDGVGCDDRMEQGDHEKGKKGFGLFSIRERVSLIGGYLKFQSKPGAGTRVEVAVPAKLTIIRDHFGNTQAT